MESKIVPDSPTMVECQNKPLTNLLNLYPGFKKNDSARPFNDQSWRSGKNCIWTFLMFPPSPHWNLCCRPWVRQENWEWFKKGGMKSFFDEEKEYCSWILILWMRSQRDNLKQIGEVRIKNFLQPWCNILWNNFNGMDRLTERGVSKKRGWFKKGGSGSWKVLSGTPYCFTIWTFIIMVAYTAFHEIDPSFKTFLDSILKKSLNCIP